MKFSLVLATIDRSAELEEFIQSLAKQAYHNYEVILVDQNDDDRLVPIVEKYQSILPILHLRSRKGLSRARNVGLKHVTGDVVAFPDDDCIYPPDLLSKVNTFFETHPDSDGVTGKAVSTNGKMSSGRWDSNAGYITKWNVWRRGISFSIFLRSYVIKSIGYFDEELGVGSGTLWGSGEETDLLLRAIESGYRIYYEPEITVIHPEKSLGQFSVTRAMFYGQGMGYVLRKHKYPIWYVIASLARPAGGALIDLLGFKLESARYRWATLLGRARGWWGKR